MRTPTWATRLEHGSTIARCVQAAVFLLSGLLAILLRFDFAIPSELRPAFHFAVPVWVLAKLAGFELFGLGRGSWRFVSAPDVYRIVAATSAATAIGAAAIIALGPPGFPRSLYALDFLLCLLLSCGVRVAVRLAWEACPRRPSAERTFVYGAGKAGDIVLRECRVNGNVPFSIVGLIDDDKEKAGTYLQGVRVLGSGGALPELARRYHAELVLIAIPSASGDEMTRILENCHRARLRFRTIPALSDIMQGRELTRQIREVALEDLLGRDPVHLEQEQIRAKLRGRTVMVTGAAGSIGSELCRQIARFEPGEIVGFDMSETGLFLLDAEMRKSFPDVAFRPEIGSIQSEARVGEVLRQYGPSVLYHAAAYKHVPLMEQHIFEAVENNVLGTFRLAASAGRYGVADFVMISTDKAVRPTSIMGATKRIAELIVNSLSGEGTTFVSVRFGNVLGSNGSVVPIFQKQIAEGGPVTVTHPEMRRYFMTIPEAAQLVLQASTMGKGGEVFVLDMGESVRIVDLAQRLILLSGLRPGEDIRTEFSGVRPGEKLYEELSALDESVLPTTHVKIRRFASNGIPPEGMEPHIETLERLCASRDAEATIEEIKALVPEYHPSAFVAASAPGRAAALAAKGNGKARAARPRGRVHEMP